MTIFENVKKNFGFGCMRLPMKNGEVDLGEFSRMVDLFLENGFNYFDTAHVIWMGKAKRLSGNVWQRGIPGRVIY